MNAFKVGDTVKLNSGGPLMIVSELFDADVKCVWFSILNEKFEDVFTVDILKKAELGI